jgi:hypothetical protein
MRAVLLAVMVVGCGGGGTPSSEPDAATSSLPDAFVAIVPDADPCDLVTCPANSTCTVTSQGAECPCDQGYLAYGGGCSPDADLDGVSEDEELVFAQEMAPVMQFDTGEIYQGRRTYWAVTSVGGGGRAVFYALSYYQDGGETLTGLTAHLGDSEFITALRTPGNEDYYFLSAHFAASTDASRWVPRSALATVTGPDGVDRPLVWIADYKHGNYPDESSCEAGALYTDTCDVGTQELVEVAPDRNLGQSWAPFLDDVTLVTDGTLNTEWYWTPVRFCGWQLSGDATADRSGCAPDANDYGTEMTLWENGML